jgi:hypothetical protein
MARASINPPISRKTVEFMYWAATLLLAAIPRTGNNPNGNKAVAAKGMASVIQKIDIMIATAAILVIVGFPPKSTKANMATGIPTPRIRPVFFNSIQL